MYDDFLSENELEEAKQEYDMIQQEKWRKSAENACRLSGVTPPKVNLNPTDGKAGPRQVEQKIVEKQMTLPFWNNKEMCVPNYFLRSSLFGVVKKGRRKFLEAQEIETLNNFSIKFSGLRLDQADLDVWEQCLSYIDFDKNFDKKIHFSAYKFLKNIGRGVGKFQYDWLKKSLLRLASAVLIIENKEKKQLYFGHLIEEGGFDEELNSYVLVINKKVAKLFGKNQYTRVSIKERQKLKGQLAKWLHGFYSSHKDPFPIKVESIYKWCGSDQKELRFFRKKLKKALKDLKNITNWDCQIDENDLVHVKKS